jgi:DNA repair protein RecN (Recombination protein N)
LSKISIVNYALIDHLEVGFDTGFSVITGETGAGKSILLGGLSLILGKRADLSSLRNKDQKCIIEAEFKINDYGLKPIFDKNDLDYDALTVIRREILPSGKSRAFVNDSPVTLDVLSQLGNNLIDIHSQNQTLQLTEDQFQFKLIDAIAATQADLDSYNRLLIEYRAETKKLNTLQTLQKEADKEQDYNTFLLSELEAAPLKDGLLEELEEQYEQLNNVELISEELSKGNQLMNDEQIGLLNLVTELKLSISKLSSFNSKYEELGNRIHSLAIELDDINTDVQRLMEDLEADPAVLEEVNAKLQLLYTLQKKHGAQDIKELISIRDTLAEKVLETANLEDEIIASAQQVDKVKLELTELAKVIRKKRLAIIPQLKTQLEKDLALLGMPSASFQITLQPVEIFKNNGMDDLSFLFSANKGTDHDQLKKVASGGELSRIMLVIKALLAKYEKLPTIMFDEIDTGVSGEISNKMAAIMQQMSKDMQVFAITHLPQVASKGSQHFKVFKYDEGQITRTNMKRLNDGERIVELAQMLGGKEVSDSALAHAKQLLN